MILVMLNEESEMNLSWLGTYQKKDHYYIFNRHQFSVGDLLNVFQHKAKLSYTLILPLYPILHNWSF